MKVKILLLHLLLILISTRGFAQITPKSNYIPCYTSELYKLQLESDTKLKQVATEAEQHFNRYAQYFQIPSAANKNSSLEGSKYIIPTVVHVVHSGFGSPDSISEAQVISMFQPLFNDLRKVPGTRGYGAGADTKIEFQLATKDPQGRPTKGITYTFDSVATKVKIDSDSMGIKPGFGNIVLKNLIRWDTTQYCNIWIVQSIGTIQSSQGTIAGYAQYPWYPSPPTDGIVVAHPFFGTNGSSKNYSSTTTHEIGHWLALIHPFDSSGKDGCIPGNCLTWGDKVCDLPPTSPGFRTITRRWNSCDSDYPDMADVSRNYMDYSDDEWKPNHYSYGQTTRSVACLENPEFYRRNKLWSQENNERCGVGSWGPPKANFWAENLRPCIGSTVQFLDYSANKPTQYRWEFIGGTPETSSEPYPKVTYNRAGKFPVRLWVNNFSNTPDSILKFDFIEVIEGAIKPPFSEGFEDNIFPPVNWRVENPDTGKIANGKPKNDLTWEQNTKFSGFAKSKKSAAISLYKYDDYGQRDALITPTFDCSGMKNIGLKYNFSYRAIRWGRQTAFETSYHRNYTDTLEVYVSEDCGATWNRVIRSGGENLMTSPEIFEIRSVTLEANADATDWKAQTINLDKWAANPQYKLSSKQLMDGVIICIWMIFKL